MKTSNRALGAGIACTLATLGLATWRHFTPFYSAMLGLSTGSTIVNAYLWQRQRQLRRHIAQLDAHLRQQIGNGHRRYENHPPPGRTKK